MNILVIGNGFDLAHRLPTKYTDFLEFCKMIMDIYTVDERGLKNENLEKIWNGLGIKVSNNGEGLKQLFFSLNTNRKKVSSDLSPLSQQISINTEYDELYERIKGNIWIDYFLQSNNFLKENWIDFECEIAYVIKSLDDDMSTLSCQRLMLEDKIQRITNKYLQQKLSDWFAKRNYLELRDTLLNDLNNLIRAFEIYLTEYIEKIDITYISPDIKEIVKCSGAYGGVKRTLYSNVISFNYTNTYEKIYWNEKNFLNRREIDYVHGKANVNSNIKSNNMVIGIDEYLGKKKRNKYVEFMAFKKFYQRIYKQTGYKYKSWVETIRKGSENSNGWIFDNNDYFKDKFHNLFFFGHSLDITDKDVLKDLILNDNVYTTIFYHDKDTMGQQIANLVKVIGQDELIRRTGGSTKTIEFRPQQPMEPIKAGDT